MLTVDINYDFNPNEPRDPAGKWTRGGSLVRRAVSYGTGKIKQFGEEDHHILAHALHKPGSAPRQRLGHHLTGVAKALPRMLQSHFKEEAHNAKHAAGALKAMAMRLPMTPEQKKGLRAFSLRALILAGSTALGGDVTGTVGHIASKLGEEFINHVLAEHSLQAGTGAASFLLRRRKQPVPVTVRHDSAFGLTSEDYKLLQDYLMKLAHAATHANIPDERVKQLLGA